MDRQIAVQLIEEYLKFGQIMNRLTELSENIDPEDRKRIRYADSEACFALYDGIVKTVLRYYPELDPPDHRLKE
jgi:hypothetical protein